MFEPVDVDRDAVAHFTPVVGKRERYLLLVGVDIVPEREGGGRAKRHGEALTAYAGAHSDREGPRILHDKVFLAVLNGGIQSGPRVGDGLGMPVARHDLEAGAEERHEGGRRHLADTAAGLLGDVVAVEHPAAGIALPRRTLTHGVVEGKRRARSDDATVQLPRGQRDVPAHALILAVERRGEAGDGRRLLREGGGKQCS